LPRAGRLAGARRARATRRSSVAVQTWPARSLRDRPYADVAAELGVAPGTLRTRVHYGLRRLRCVLETAA